MVNRIRTGEIGEKHDFTLFFFGFFHFGPEDMEIRGKTEKRKEMNGLITVLFPAGERGIWKFYFTFPLKHVYNIRNSSGWLCPDKKICRSEWLQ